MRSKSLKVKKKIIANLSDAESNLIRGGTSYWSIPGYGCTSDACPSGLGSCLCGATDSQDFSTICCLGGTYADCTFSNHCK